ncbi:MAG: hypothetical protein U5L75_00825 [Candidatus Campbellbacteria bacterium]|nr:hypothetical protein [Candidatus Campbellbacteria bacterium]
MPRELFINTIQGSYQAEPSGRKMVIFGRNGVIGDRIKARLEEEGHEVMLIASPKIESVTEEMFKDIDTFFILAYDLEPIDVHIGSSEFLKKVREKALVAGVSRGVLLESITTSKPNQPVYRDVLARAESFLSDSAIPLTSYRASLLLDVDLLLAKSISSYVADDVSPLLPDEAKEFQCQPILLKEAVEFIVRAVDHEIERTYRFDLGGNDKISYQEFVDLFVEKERRKSHTLGFSPLPKRERLASLSSDEHTAWNVFLEKTTTDMTVDEERDARKHFSDIKTTPLKEAINLI